MHYRSLLVHVTSCAAMPARTRMAARLALDHDAHITGVATTGLTQFIYQCSALAPDVPFVENEFRQFREQVDAQLAAFGAALERAGVRSRDVRRLDDDVDTTLVLQSRFCDLAIIGQTDPDDPLFGNSTSLPQHLVLQGARPVLIHPYAGQFDTIGKRTLLAWDGSVHATRAIAAALPLLRDAGRATVATFNTGRDIELRGAEAAAGLIAWLQRHGVQAELAAQQTAIGIGDALLSLAADLDADLLVMGGYGHLRVREFVLGGATRTVLGSMTLPVLMAH